MHFVRCCFRALLVLGGLAVAATAADSYTFTREGVACVPPVVELGDGSQHPGPGDAVIIGWDTPFILDGPGAYAFRHAGAALYLSRDGAPEQLVSVDASRKDAEGGESATRAAVPRAAQGALRVLTVDGTWEPGVIDPEAIDWSRLVVVLRISYLDDKPVVPAGIATRFHHLLMDSSMSGGSTPRDLAPLLAGTSLRWLRLSGWGAQPISGAVLGRHTGLRQLEISGGAVADAAALAGCRELRHLELNWMKDTTLDLGFLAGLEQLTYLDVQQSRIASLGPALPLPALARIKADACSVTALPALPAIAAPALRSLELIGSTVAADAVERFRKINPACAVQARWSEPLDDAIAKTDRILLRSGGTCHRQQAREKQLWESRERGEIEAFARLITIDEAASGGECMCCGSASVELWRGDVLLTTIGMHHGSGVRLAGSAAGWPGDARLMADSSDRLCAWLRQHHDQATPDEWAQGRKRAAAAERMMAEYTRILGAAPMEALRKAKGETAVAEIFTMTWPAQAQRAAMLLRLFGCGVREWSGQWGLDRWIEQESGLKNEGIAAALLLLATDGDGLDGAARWCSTQLAALAERDRSAAGPTLSARALADPHPANREAWIIALDGCSDAWATTALRSALAGIAPRELPADRQVDANDMVVAHPRKWSPPRGVATRTLAALALLRRHDADSLPAVRALAQNSTGADKAALDEELAQQK